MRGYRVHLDEQEPIVSIDDFVSTYSNPTDSRCEAAVGHLAIRGALPLRFDSPALEDLNILAAWLMWSGSISGYQSGIHLDDAKFKKGIREIGKRLGLPFKDTGNFLIFGKNAAPYSRIIHLMGIYNSRGTRECRDTKANNPIELPEYVQFLAKNYKYMAGEDKCTARKILIDQCRVLLYSKLVWSGTYEINMIANKSKQKTRKLARQVIKMFNAVYPRLGLSNRLIGTKYGKERKNHTAIIRMGLDIVAKGAVPYGLFNSPPLNTEPEYHTRERYTTYKGANS